MFFEPIPQLDPTNRLIIIIVKINCFGVVINKRKIGATFCQVKKTNETIGDNFTIRAVPQKCSGANLVLSSTPRVTHLARIPLYLEITLLLSTINEPTLCTMKYSIPLFLAVHFLVIKVINAIIFTSNIIQIAGHVSEEIAPREPIITPNHTILSSEGNPCPHCSYCSFTLFLYHEAVLILVIDSPLHLLNHQLDLG